MATCARCKKGLKDPISIQRGLGPVCWAKAQADKSKEEQRESGGIYDGGDIILRLVDGNYTTNVPHAIVRHSPTGFAWGYGGSGPADLALNILYAVTGSKDIADQYYQEFKWAFLAPMPAQGGVIEKERIIAWLKERGVDLSKPNPRAKAQFVYAQLVLGL